jgi:hypothetical protein
MSKLSKKLGPPPRPDFNRENTRFISLAEMQKQDPSLRPKKETRKDKNNWVRTALAVLTLIASGKIYHSVSKRTISPDPSVVEVRSIKLPEKINFIPPAPHPYQAELAEMENSQVPDTEMIEREPAYYEEEYHEVEEYSAEVIEQDYGSEP